MRLLSLDQATAKTGWALFEDGQIVDYGVINMSKAKVEPDERVAMMIGEIVERIADCGPELELVVIEDVALQKDAAALTKLARVQGGILGACYPGIKCEIMKPSVWRKELGFHQGKSVTRPELKRQAKDYVALHFNLKVTEDEADAICIGCAAVKKYI